MTSVCSPAECQCRKSQVKVTKVIRIPLPCLYSSCCQLLLCQKENIGLLGKSSLYQCDHYNFCGVECGLFQIPIMPPLYLWFTIKTWVGREIESVPLSCNVGSSLAHNTFQLLELPTAPLYHIACLVLLYSHWKSHTQID